MPTKQASPHLIIGTRHSRLARWQSEYIAQQLTKAWPNLSYELRPFQTKGDRTLDRPLPEIGGKGLFTAELEQALLSGEIDIAVHSLKDLPVEDAPGLTIGAIPEREDVTDVLVTGGDHTMATLPPGAVVGTSSLRRQAQVLAVRPDLHVRSIRGNVETRVHKVREGDYDAAILAAAGLKRLELLDAAGSRLPLDAMLPAPGQGALAVQCRATDEPTHRLLRAIEHAPTRRAATAERRFLQALGGGCSAPIAAYAREQENQLHMDALIASPDGGTVIRVSGTGTNPLALAEQLAAEARRRGAGEILEAVQAAGASATMRPLDGLQVVVTRARHQAPEFTERLQKLGANPLLFPTIKIVPFDDSRELDEAIVSVQEYDWVIFTSVNGVAIFGERMEALGLAASQFDGVRVAAIGPATATALQELGRTPDFVPDEFVAERIAEGLGDVAGQRILLPRAEQARAALAELLQDSGASVNEIPSYRTVLASPESGAAQKLQGADIFTFTSSSTVRNFVALVGGEQQAATLVSGAKVACIGPITAATAREHGLKPQIVAEDYTIDGLIAAIVAAVQ